MFIDMCEYFCEAINKGDLPEISNNWDVVCKAEAQRIFSYCENEFNNLMTKYERMHTHEISLDQYEKEVETKMTELLKHLEKNALGDKEKFKKELKKKIKGKST